MGHPCKRSDELLAALATEFEFLISENAALVKELESLRERTCISPSNNKRTLASRQEPLQGDCVVVADESSTNHVSNQVMHQVTARTYSATPASRSATTSLSAEPKPRSAVTTPASRSALSVEANTPRKRGWPWAVLPRHTDTNGDMPVEECYQSFYDLSREFHMLCAKHKTSITAREICAMDIKQKGSTKAKQEEEEETLLEQETLFEQAITEVNNDLPKATRSKRPSQEMMLETYSMLMSGRTAESKLEQAGKDQLIEAVCKMRDILLREDAIRQIALASNMGWEDLYVSKREGANPWMTTCLRYLDPFTGFMILLNAIVIGISADYHVGHEAWDWCEWGFTLIFFLEVILKVWIRGFSKHFLGNDMLGNIFDFCVVMVAVLDLIVTVVGGLVMLGNVSLIRLVRFARLTKLVGVLKLKVFKELALLVNGCFVGFRTLLWAIVFLNFILFALGVVLKGSFGEPEPVYYPRCPNATFFPEEAALVEYNNDCLRSAAHLDEHRLTLFGNVPRSMFTVFRCFTDGCSAPDGTPLVPPFYDTHGAHVVITYTLCFLFVIFGLFNLIMAVFVENTIENAKHNEHRRRDARTHEHIRVAKKLHEVILIFCAGEQDHRFIVDKPTTRAFDVFKNVFSTRWRRTDSSLPLQTCDRTASLSLRVSHAAFHKIVKKPEVQELLDDLDIGYSSRSGLWDVLDADGNGVLEMSELVHGLLKLRGTAEKGDNVAALLAIRSLQRSVKALELLGLKQQESIDLLHRAHERVESHVKRISRATHGQETSSNSQA